MGEWAKAAYRRLATKEGQGHAENQRLALERQQVVDTAPVLWEQLVDVITEEVADFHEMRPGYLTAEEDAYGDNPSMTLRAEGRRVRAVFDKRVPRITYEVLHSQGPQEKDLEFCERIFYVQGGLSGSVDV